MQLVPVVLKEDAIPVRPLWNQARLLQTAGIVSPRYPLLQGTAVATRRLQLIASPIFTTVISSLCEINF